MFVRLKNCSLAFCLLVSLSSVSFGASFKCAVDLNNDNDTDDMGEIELCVQSSAKQEFCPISAVDCVKAGNAYSCPLGQSYICSTNSLSPSVPQCSKSVCVDASETPLIDTAEGIDSGMLQDDGDRNAEGVCLGETRIFSGRPMSCRLPGVKSAYKNCCSSNKGRIYHDSQGNVVENTLTNKAIIATAAAAYAAGAAYSAAISAGAGATQAANAGGQAFVNSLQGAFDPTSLAIAVAIALIQEWLANACDQESTETAALKASKYCFTVGEVCTSRWLGSCVQREEVNCCYNSMLARIVNEQGRPQLLGNDPSSKIKLDPSKLDPLDCGGFTPEQFQALDFQTIDFSEYHAEINGAITERIDQEAEAAIERFKSDDIN